MNLFGREVSVPLGRPRAGAGRWSVVSLCAVLLASGLAACGSSAAGSSAGSSPSASGPGAAAKLVPASLKDKTVSVAVLNNYPPGGFMEGGNLTGYGPDLARAVAADAGLNLNLQAASFDVIIPGLQSHRWDFAIPPFAVTDARLKVLDVVPVHSSGTVYIVRSGGGLSISSGTDLCGHTVGGLQGATELTYTSDLSKECQQAGKPAIGVQSFGSQDDAVLALSSSRVEAVATGAATAAYLVRSSSGKFSVAPFTYKSNLQGIGFAKGSDELEPVIAQAMKDLAANGEYKRILDKYGMGNLAVSDFDPRK